jgi:hypothetical protein
MASVILEENIRHQSSSVFRICFFLFGQVLGDCRLQVERRGDAGEHLLALVVFQAAAIVGDGVEGDLDVHIGKAPRR